MTSGSTIGETTKAAPQAQTRPTSSAVMTVPAPIVARVPAQSTARAIRSSACGEVSEISIAVTPPASNASRRRSSDEVKSPRRMPTTPHASMAATAAAVRGPVLMRPSP